jgi:hypothetical protein
MESDPVAAAKAVRMRRLLCPFPLRAFRRREAAREGGADNEIAEEIRWRRPSSS